jgi:hypothetical protein
MVTLSRLTRGLKDVNKVALKFSVTFIEQDPTTNAQPIYLTDEFSRFIITPMLTIEIYRGAQLILSTKPNEQSNVKQDLMGEHTLTLQFILDRMIDLRIGDYCMVYGNTYYIHSQKLPVITKNSRFGFDYDVQLMSSQYLLQNVQFLDDLSQSNFSLFGTADTFIDLLISQCQA